MLSIRIKKYIEEITREQYQQIYDKEGSIESLRIKIDNFDKFLEVFRKNPKYQEPINNIIEELERVSQEEGMLSFYKVANIQAILQIIIDIKKLQINETIEAFKELGIIRNNDIYNIVFQKDSTNNLINSVDKIKEVEEYLKSIKRIELIPYVKTFYICTNQSEFERIKTGKMPINTYWNYTSNLFIAYLELANKIRDIIMEKYFEKQVKVKEYVEEIKQTYENKIQFKYIPSSVIKIDTEITEEDNESAIPFIEINDNTNLKKIKLIGYAGVGKTTTLEYIEYKDALNYEEAGKLPIILSLITVEKDENIENLICRKLKLDIQNIDIVKYLLEKNKINLYLDGVNEINISNYEEKRKFLNRLEEFINKKDNENLKVIVTDRDNSEVSVLNNCDTYLIQGMTEKDIELFIEGNSRADKIEETKNIIKQNDEFSSMVMQPIMLKNLITIIECGEKIPEDIEELSEVYLESIIKREAEEKKDNYANYINDALTYMVKKSIENSEEDIELLANIPTSYFKVLDIFINFAQEKHIEIDDNGETEFDAERLLNLVKKMGILKEVEFQKYAFLDEKFFHIYNYKAITEEC